MKNRLRAGLTFLAFLFGGIATSASDAFVGSRIDVRAIIPVLALAHGVLIPLAGGNQHFVLWRCGKGRKKTGVQPLQRKQAALM